MSYTKGQLEDIAAVYKLNSRFMHEFKTPAQADVLKHIQDECKEYWHKSYMEAKKNMIVNPGRDLKKITDSTNELIHQLEKNYLYVEQKTINCLKELQVRMAHVGLSGRNLTSEELLTYYAEEASKWMLTADFSKTKIKDLNPIIRNMVKTGDVD